MKPQKIVLVAEKDFPASWYENVYSKNCSIATLSCPHTQHRRSTFIPPAPGTKQMRPISQESLDLPHLLPSSMHAGG